MYFAHPGQNGRLLWLVKNKETKSGIAAHVINENDHLDKVPAYDKVTH